MREGIAIRMMTGVYSAELRLTLDNKRAMQDLDHVNAGALQDNYETLEPTLKHPSERV